MKLDTLNRTALADAFGLTDSNHRAALRTGIDDGHEQGFELSMGMSYDDLDAQWAYDMGTYIGACWAVREETI